MWVASWNEKGYTNLNATAQLSDTGYKINEQTIVPLKTEEDQTEYYDTLYFPYREGVNPGSFNNTIKDTDTTFKEESWGYWLATPSAGGNSHLCTVDVDGDIDYYTYGSNRSLRPIVSLKSEIKGNKDNGIWKLAQ